MGLGSGSASVQLMPSRCEVYRSSSTTPVRPRRLRLLLKIISESLPAQRRPVVGRLAVDGVAHAGVHPFGRVEGVEVLAVLHQVVVRFQRHVQVLVLLLQRVVVELHPLDVGAAVLEGQAVVGLGFHVWLSRCSSWPRRQSMLVFCSKLPDPEPGHVVFEQQLGSGGTGAASPPWQWPSALFCPQKTDTC